MRSCASLILPRRAFLLLDIGIRPLPASSTLFVSSCRLGLQPAFWHPHSLRFFFAIGLLLTGAGHLHLICLSATFLTLLGSFFLSSSWPCLLGIAPATSVCFLSCLHRLLLLTSSALLLRRHCIIPACIQLLAACQTCIQLLLCLALAALPCLAFIARPAITLHQIKRRRSAFFFSILGFYRPSARAAAPASIRRIVTVHFIPCLFLCNCRSKQRADADHAATANRQPSALRLGARLLAFCASAAARSSCACRRIHFLALLAFFFRRLGFLAVTSEACMLLHARHHFRCFFFIQTTSLACLSTGLLLLLRRVVVLASGFFGFILT